MFTQVKYVGHCSFRLIKGQGTLDLRHPNYEDITQLFYVRSERKTVLAHRDVKYFSVFQLVKHFWNSAYSNESDLFLVLIIHV